MAQFHGQNPRVKISPNELYNAGEISRTTISTNCTIVAMVGQNKQIIKDKKLRSYSAYSGPSQV